MKAVLAVQEPSKDVILCERCFAMVKAGAEFCPDCGAPIQSDDTTSEGSDAAIYPELARANLLRMRSEYKQAEEICLSILRRYPNNATANGLLGDMKAEQGDLEQAAEWYELALDLIDDSTVKTKLYNVKKRIQEREAANTAKQIGLPSGKPKVGMYLLVMLVLIGGSASAAYWIGQQSGTTARAKGGAMDRPLNIPGKTGGDRPQAPSTEGTDSTTNNADSLLTIKADVDRTLLESIAKASPIGAKAIDAFQDPRTKILVVTFVASESDSLRETAAQIGKIALDSHLESAKVVLRGIVGNRMAIVADMTRDSVHLVDSQEWKDAHANDQHAWANEVLTNVWPPTLPADTSSRTETAAPSEHGDASGERLRGN